MNRGLCLPGFNSAPRRQGVTSSCVQFSSFIQQKLRYRSSCRACSLRFQEEMIKCEASNFRKGIGAKWLGIITSVHVTLTVDLNSGKSWNPIVCGTDNGGESQHREGPAAGRGRARLPAPSAEAAAPSFRSCGRSGIGQGNRCPVCTESKLQSQNSNPALPGSWPGTRPPGHSASQSPLGSPGR